VISIGVSGAWSPELVGELAVHVEHAGFDRLWVNDVPNGEALLGVSAALSTTTRLRVATGVIALDRRPATQVLGRLRQLQIPVDRLDLGIGSGGWSHPVPRVADAVEELRSSGARLWLGALGPGMRKLGAERWDGLLLNWLTPEVVRDQVQLAHTQAAATGRPAPGVALYVRTAIDHRADAVLEEEAARYAGFPGYSANFARLGIDPLATTIRSTDDAKARLAEFEAAAGEVVVRVVVPGEPTLDDALVVLEATRPAA
jgi:alkanesulfonate monooxygenase SsuD/methylene tetrahydromethanopterin reductase-like flavin-dependent oxidoreductase (luciferase family)